MSVFEKIIAFLKPKKSKSFESVPNDKTKVMDGLEKEIFISPILSKTNYSVKYTTTMINSITLSSDMKTLYLIDNGRAIDFPIDTKNGVLIGSFKGQIAVATSLTQEEEGTGATGVEGGRAASVNKDVIRVTTERKQWTLTYHKRSGILAIIGATEIDSSLRSEPECEEHRVNLNDSVIKIKRKGNEIELTVFDR